MMDGWASDPNPHKEAETHIEFDDPPLTRASAGIVIDDIRLLRRHIDISQVKQLTELPELTCASTPVEVGSFVNRVADVMGIADCRIHIRFGTVSESVGGYVSVNQPQGEATVCIGYGLADFPACVMAVICHELSHVALCRLGIAKNTVIETEMLTDCAAVFFGFGSIMLNGCTEAFVKSSGQVVRIFGHQIGYLTPSQVALAYNIVSTFAGREIDLRLLDKHGCAVMRRMRKFYCQNCEPILSMLM